MTERIVRDGHGGSDRQAGREIDAREKPDRFAGRFFDVERVREATRQLRDQSNATMV